jgi:tetratricopeptide (TPR) repeat protein
VGRRLREAREAADLSQRQLAFPGCSPAYISRIEAGDRIPSLQLLRELGRRLGVSEDYLATGSEGRPQSFLLLEAELALRFDDLDRAGELYRGALEQAVRPIERAQAEEGLGQLALRTGEVREAIGYFERALAAFGAEESERPALAESLGRAYMVVGELEPAVAIFERCLAAFEERGDRIAAIRFACLLGYALSEAGEFARAEEVVARALAEGRESLDPYMRARVYWARAKVLGDQGDLEGASPYAYQALAAIQLTEDLHYTGLAHQLVARLELERGRAAEALEYLAQGWPLLERSGSPIEQAQFRAEQTLALARLGETEEAAALGDEVSALLGDADPSEAGRIHAILAEVALEMGDEEEAEASYLQAVERLERQPPARDLVDAYAKLAELMEAKGRSEDAYSYMKKAIGVQQQLPARALKA